MKRALTVIAAAATLALASVAAPQSAEARCHGCGAAAAGLIGGLAIGAIIGSAASGPHYAAPAYGYYGPGPVYYRPHCWWRRERVWDGWGWRVQRVRVCR